MTKTKHWLRSLGLRKIHSRTPALGERELAVMRLLWQEPELTAVALHERMEEAGITLNTVQSTLERLVRKGLLLRQKRARAYVYSAALSQAALISSLLRDISHDVAGGEMVPMVSGFAEFLTQDSNTPLRNTLPKNENADDE